MNSNNSSRKRAGAVRDPILGNVTRAPVDAGAESVRSIEKSAEFLEQFEAVFGPDNRPRPATVGWRLLL
jgi:hypothetical protein